MTYNKYEVQETHTGRSNKGITVRNAPSNDNYADTATADELHPGDTFVAHESVADGFSDRVKVVEEDVDASGDSEYVNRHVEHGDHDGAPGREVAQSSTADQDDDAEPAQPSDGGGGSGN